MAPSQDNIDERTRKPTPDDFDAFFPWVCNQFQVDVNVIVTRIQNKCLTERKLVLSTLKNPSPRSKLTEKPKSKISVQSRTLKPKAKIETDEIHFLGQSCFNLKSSIEFDDTKKEFYLLAYYDNANLVKLKFDKNNKIPQALMKVLRFVIKYFPKVINVSINRGLDNNILNNLNELLKVSNITELCLDDTSTSHASYDILLKNETTLKHMSLSRCNIDDDMIRKIASKLANPLPASKALLILNLASNRITDIGAIYLADALRSNRHLCYINLAGNLISDDGSIAILDVLKQFIVSSDELEMCRSDQIVNWNYKKNLSSQMSVEQVEEKVSAIMLTNSVKKTAKKPKKITPVQRNLLPQQLENIDINKHPFSKTNTYVADGVTYCLGNNQLAYLNLSYNNVSYITVKKLLEVLNVQNALARNPKGLVNVSIEGNFIPDSCLELKQIDDILGSALEQYGTKKHRRNSTKN